MINLITVTNLTGETMVTEAIEVLLMTEMAVNSVTQVKEWKQ